VIEARALVKRFGAHEALKGIDLSIDQGELFGLIGPDGAGKTTFFRLVAGLLEPTSGAVTRDPDAAFGFVPQRFGLYEDLSIDENLRLRAKLYSVPAAEALPRAKDLLRRVGLERFGARLAGALSGGMKQKLALVAALLTRPPLLLLDEPTTGVDPVSRREFWKLLSEFLSHGLTIVMATPYLDEAERCGRVALLHEGRLLALDAPATLTARLHGQLIEVITDTPRPPLEELAALAGVEDVQSFGERAHVRLSGKSGEDAVAGVREGLEHRGLRVIVARAIPPSLEDVFIDLIEGAETGARAASAGGRSPGRGSQR